MILRLLFALITLTTTLFSKERIPCRLVNNSVDIITGDYFETVVDIKLPGLSFERQYRSSTGWSFNHPLPQPRILYDFEKGLLATIKRMDHKGEQALHWIKCHYPSEGLCEVESSKGERLFYHGVLLEKVEIPGKPTILYSYKNGRLHCREDTLGHLLRMEYDEKGRVKEQWQGDLLLARFSYPDAYTTEVIDARGGKQLFKHDGERVVELSDFLDGVLYRTEQYHFENGVLASITLLDGEGALLLKENYDHDKKGRLTLHGSTSYIYEGDSKNPSCIREDNNRAVRYLWKGDLCLAKFLCEGDTIRMRTFYSYDEEDTLVKVVSDDGSAIHPDDLAAVSERHLTYLQNSMVEERVLDLKTMQEMPLRATLYQYGPFDKLTEKQMFDENGVCIYAAHYGETTSWDSEGNERSNRTMPRCETIERTHKGEKSVEKLVYGANNLLLSRTIDDSTDYFRYEGALCVEVESLGQVTKRQYDSLGRLIRIISPEVLDADDQLVCYTASQSYDLFDRVIERIDANGYKTKMIYGKRGELLEVLYPDGTSELMEYAPDGTLIKKTNRIGLTTPYTRDCLGETRLFKPPARKESSAECRYDGMGNKILQRDTAFFRGVKTRTLTTRWFYGPGNRLEKVIEADGTETIYHYNRLSQLEEIVKKEGVLRYSYNALGRIHEQCSSDGTIHYRYLYDANGRISSVEDLVQKNVTLREYSSHGQLLTESLGNGLTVANCYDRQGRRTELQLPDGSSIGYEYDDAHLTAIHRLSSSGELLYSHRFAGYDLSGRLLGAELIKGLGEAVFIWDEKKRFCGLHTPFFSEKVDYNEEGLITHVVTEDQNHSFYSYDETGQIEEESGVISQSYQFDSLFEPIVAKPLREDLQHRYDALNRLTEVIREGVFKISYTYDAFNRRLTSSRYHADGKLAEKKLFLYDGKLEIGSFGDSTELRVMGNDHVVAMELGESLYAVIQDHLGSVSCLVDAKSGKVFESYRYSAFGECSIKTSKNPWRFTNQRYDEESGYLFFGNRYYDPKAHRFLTEDPFGFIDGSNRYAYLGNEPLSRVDHGGLFSWHSLWDGFCGYLNQEIDKTMRESFTRPFLTMFGRNDHESFYGVTGQGEIGPHVRITFINGILNTHDQAFEQGNITSLFHGGANVHYLYRASGGWSRDIMRCFATKMGYITAESQLLVQTWRTLLQEMDGNGTVIHYAHSIGSTETWLARSLLTPEEKQKIRIITFGAPKILPNEEFADVLNCVSIRDGVCWLDPIGFFQAFFAKESSHVVFVGSLTEGLPIVDHFMANDNYNGFLEEMGKAFVAKNGSLLF